ncbi:MAG: EscU/YscU/HrcU family type III secretion system export apparatus switch protein [Desulfobulbaceae bacterium]|jgi:flagellar biosynthesis protein|nr:EscU/YscU/HrcU family type III secretion system export apparatus switch protein [Desulfobulbaceae bacterium]
MDAKREKAVALLYDENKSSAPRVVASGTGKVARKIIETAAEAGVHIQKDPNLIELLAKVPVGEEIPTELYATVAEVLAFVYRVNEKYKSQKMEAERPSEKNRSLP